MIEFDHTLFYHMPDKETMKDEWDRQRNIVHIAFAVNQKGSWLNPTLNGRAVYVLLQELLLLVSIALSFFFLAFLA
jgi:hypothetical protein